jgi:5-(carboxyamino)imidazole ribonucleotide synthase
MLNILGDAWAKGEPDWTALQAQPGTHLHLYGKAEARPGRKMGHFNVLADGPEAAHLRARELKAAMFR